MSADKSQPTAQEIYYAAEKCLPRLPEELQAQIDVLLVEARAGRKRDNAIIALISDDRDARQWMRQALFGDQFETLRGYQPLAGGGPVVPANSLWRCPQCDFEWRVLQAGRPVPHCPDDGSVLVQVQTNSEQRGA